MYNFLKVGQVLYGAVVIAFLFCLQPELEVCYKFILDIFDRYIAVKRKSPNSLRIRAFILP